MSLKRRLKMPTNRYGVSSIISIIVLLFGASGIFAELQDALNTVWEVQPKPERGLINVIRSRFFVVLDGARRWLLLLVSLVTSCWRNAGQFGHLLPPGLDFSGRW